MLRIAVRALVVLGTVGVPAVTLFACVQPPALVVETSAGDVVRLESWTAPLTSIASNVRGTASLEPGSTYRETRATISISGAAPGSAHAWLVQLGECGHELGVLSGPMAYTPITVGADGAGRSAVTLPFTVPTSGRYSVMVRATELATSRAVACGNLTKSPLVSGPTIANAPAP
jgi:hypothetical protein